MEKYCNNCGQQLNGNENFCSNCGNPIKQINSNDNTKRQTTYSGVIHKCPNCGETLKSFMTNCPSCGHEIRGEKPISAIKEFSSKLEAIEAKREHQKSGLFKNTFSSQEISKTDEQKISLIRSFAIPNTKEDLFEFLILSISNIDVDSYESDIPNARKAVSDAWKAKFEQAYQKAKMMFPNDPKFKEIEKSYKSTNKSIKNAKWKLWKLVGIIYGILFIVLILVFATVNISKNKEIKRLENIVIQIEAALEEEDYKLALMNAERLDFNGDDEGIEKDWTIKRDYWIDKIIDEASKNGISLSKPSNDNNQNIDNSSNDSNSSTNFEDDNKENSTNEPKLDPGVTVNSNEYINIKEVAYTVSGEYLRCVVVLNNPSSDTVIENPKFRVTAYNKDGQIIGSDERVLSVIYPKQDFADQGTFMTISEEPYKIDVTMLKPEDDDITSSELMDHPNHKQMFGKNIAVHSDKITGEIYNPNDYEIESAMITVVFRDSKGIIVSSRVGFVEQIPANGSVPFDISLFSNEIDSKVEVYAYIW